MTLCDRLRQPVMLHYNAEAVNAERREAADEIERLRGVLEGILGTYAHDPNCTAGDLCYKAQEGLRGENEQDQSR